MSSWRPETRTEGLHARLTRTGPLGSHPLVICGTCGCDNAGHLVFCQECGQRLGPRVAAPTPPIGVVPGASAAGEPGNPSARAAINPCSRCSSENQPGVRYCVTCGNVLTAPQPIIAAPPATPEPVAVSKLEPPRAPAPVGPPIVPAAVYQVVAARVDVPPAIAPVAPPVVAAAPATTATRICPRCRGTSDDLAQFCRFCGAVLGGSVQGKPDALASETAGRISPTITDPPVQAFWRPPVPAGFPVPASLPPAVPIPAPSAPALPGSLAHSTDGGASFGRIVIITKEGGEGASYAIRDRLDIGRTEGEVIIGADRYLSPRHARLVCRSEPGKPPELVLVDLGSTNGIYLRLGREGSREVTLEDQDLFLVGQQVLKFEAVRDAEEGLAPATQHGTLLFGTPSVPRYARLSQRTVEGVTRDVFHIQKAETVLGRESGDIVFTDDPFLSRRHASVKFDPEGRRFVLTDLGSSNGTFVQIRGQVTIKSGDQFRIGQQLFRVDLSAAPAP
jgi:pSer/pThr/pTyr-binding forkhead associated (FHA) protein